MIPKDLHTDPQLLHDLEVAAQRKMTKQEIDEQRVSFIASVVPIEKEVIRKLLEQQQDLDPEFAKILNDNLWDLYSR